MCDVGVNDGGEGRKVKEKEDVVKIHNKKEYKRRQKTGFKKRKKNEK